MSSVREQVAELSDEEKRALLAQLLGQDGDREGERLLPSQRRYWVLHQVSPQVPTHVVRVVEVRGGLDVDVLNRAFDALIDAHESLRTSYVAVEGRPVRGVAEPGAVRPGITVLDVADDAELHRVRVREAGRAFDLETAPLLRLSVLRRGSEHHEVILTAHQMLADEVTTDLLLGELADIHHALATDGTAAAPAEPAASLADVVSHERTWLATPQARRETEFWTKRLAAVPTLELPTDRPRPVDRMPSLSGARAVRQLDADLVGAARQLADAQGASLSDVTLAALVAVLSRYTLEQDITVGLPVDGRVEPQYAGVLAPLENTVVVRADLGGEPSFRQLVDRVGTSRREAEQHQRLPFEQVVAQLKPEADFSRSPLHQVRFVDRRSAFGSRDVGGASWSVTDVDTGLSAFDLTVYAHDGGDGYRLVGEYNAELFKPETVERFLGHLAALLGAALADPDRRCADLKMLSDAETDLVLRQWNDTTAELPASPVLHTLIAEQVERTPAGWAVMSGGQRLTYRELDDWANKLANHLRGHGVGPEELVAVMAHRRVSTVVGFLAVLKAGGGYVPVDPEQPADRMRAVIADAGARIVISSEAIEALADDPSLLRIAPEADEVLAGSDAAPEVSVDPANTAYVIYTSGSTGRPKGVVVPHRQIVNSTLARSAFGREAPESYAIPVALSFDASAAGLYWTLLTGGRIVLPSEDQVRNPALLARLVQTERITHITHMPSYYQLLLAAGGRQLISLKDISAGGDVFPAQLAVDHYKLLPWTKLYNDYGPTEVTVWATAQLSGAEEDGASVAIGRPIQNTQVYLLDANLQPVPVGVPGEIHVAGDGLARGYLGQPGLTADRFIPNPFAAQPGDRLYRTGDLARYLPDGRLEFLGRVDTQVKIRGFRIELGEIENALQQHPDVTSAVVDLRRTLATDEGSLVAWVIPADPADAPTAAELTGHLQKLLPGYMIPSAIVTCAEFPLNAHGKVDRRALPEPEVKAVSLPTGEVPRRRIEKEIADVFAEALGVARVGLHDDFFSFGGSSLQLSRVGARLSKAYGMELPLHALFSTPTVSGVAARVELYEREGFEGLKATRDAVDDLDREAVLDETITGEGLPQADFFAPKAIFLTGATGYFGVFLLDQLIEQTDADIYCLVRARDVAGGMARLKNSCAMYEVPWDDRFERRVKAVIGDLGRPLFGLSPSNFDDLAKVIDTIYHNGALVNFSLPYSALKAPNVDGTVEMLRLASRYKVKQVHFVSTIDVFIAGHMTRPFLEVDLPAKPPQVPFSYPQSKWVSEKIIMKARERGLPVTIFRPSIMMGHPRTGACHAQNYVLTALRGFLEFGILPDYPESMNAITLDYASAAMVHVSRQEASLGNIYHLWNTDAIPHNALFPWIKSYGYPFEVVDFDEAVQLAINAGPDHPVYPMVPVLLLYTSGDAGLEMSMETEEAIDNRMECINLLDGIKGMGYEPAPLDEKYMHDCLDFLVRHGHLDPPSAFPRKR